MTQKTDVLIIGSGPAGWTAGIYCARAMLSTLILSGSQPGGQLTITTDVENWPGEKNIQGPKLMENLEEHALHAGAVLEYDTVVSLQKDEFGFVAVCESGTLVRAKAVILATGATARWLGVEGEEKYQGYGVSACATCDGFFFKDKVVAVVGGGNTAMEEAIFLSRMASHVHIIHRKDSFRAEKTLQNHALSLPNITIHFSKEIHEIKGRETQSGLGVDSVILKDSKTGERETLDLDGVFVAIGHDPASSLVSHLVELEDGYVKTFDKSTKTSLDGLFAAGDISDPIYRQAITSAGAGCMAALDAAAWIASLPQEG